MDAAVGARPATRRRPAGDVLTSAHTFSGGEEFAYGLQAMGRAVVVGETTAGAANPFTVYDLGPTMRLHLPDRRLENPHTGTNWQAVGVVPDVAVPAGQACETAHRLARAAAAEQGGGRP